MKTDPRAMDALTRLSSEAKVDDVPPIDWDRLEAKLEARVAEAPRARGTAPWSAKTGWLALAAVAFGVGGTALLLTAKSDPPAVSVVTEDIARVNEAAPVHVDATTLAIGAKVVAAAAPVSVEHVGHVVWTLDAGSAAHIESNSSIVTVALDRGALVAHVTKSSLPESFVVRVEGTRIAVHGTVFRVARSATGVDVELSEGVVAVGPLGRKGTELFAPAKASLDLAGARTDVPAARPPSATPAPAPREPEPAVQAPDAAAQEPAEEAPATTTSIADAVRRCLAKHTVARGDLRVTVGTKLSLAANPDGSVREVRFAPPLAPAVNRCVEGELASMRFARTEHGFAVEERLELDR